MNIKTLKYIKVYEFKKTFCEALKLKVDKLKHPVFCLRQDLCLKILAKSLLNKSSYSISATIRKCLKALLRSGS